jgi:PadR family transcriptional regulator PadR
MKTRKSNPPFLNGVPELLILKLLTRKEMYGYEIVREIELATNELLSFGEGSIYPILHALEKNGFLAVQRQLINGRNRLYYQITESGLKQLEKMSQAWEKTTKGVSLALGGAYGG